MNDYAIRYDPIRDYAPIVSEEWIPNEGVEGVVEFFLADKGISPESGDDAIITEHFSNRVWIAYWTTDENGKIELEVTESIS